ncbi:glycosyltransferase [Vibrio sp. AK197]
MEKKLPLVSVIMPCFNAENTIRDSIDSVLRQDYATWELIVVDDYSSDSSNSIINSFSDERIKLITNNLGKGVAGARNSGISHAKGKYICFLDADDKWYYDKLSSQVILLESSDYFVSHASYIRVTPEDKELNEVVADDLVRFEDMLSGNKIGNLTGIYDASALGKFYQEDVGHEDYLMWLHITKISPSKGIAKSLGRYTVSGDSVSANKLKSAYWHFSLLYRSLEIPFFKCIYFFISYALNNILKRI